MKTKIFFVTSILISGAICIACKSDGKFKHNARNPRCSFQGDVSETVRIPQGLEKTRAGYKIRIQWQAREAANGRPHAPPLKIADVQLVFGLECAKPYGVISRTGAKVEISGAQELTLSFDKNYFRSAPFKKCKSRNIIIPIALGNQGYTRDCSWGNQNVEGLRFIVLAAKLNFNQDYSKILTSKFQGYDYVEY